MVQITNTCEYGCKYLISYLKYFSDVPDLVISNARLVGGKAGTSPWVEFSEIRKYSPNLIFNPID